MSSELDFGGARGSNTGDVYHELWAVRAALKLFSIPVLPELKVVIAATPTGNLAFLVTAFGKPFTSNGFGNWFRKQCDAAGLKHCSAHGLRKAGAALAAENGATERQLMAIFGWTTMKEASRYTRAARQKVLAASGMKLLSREGGGPEREDGRNSNS